MICLLQLIDKALYTQKSRLLFSVLNKAKNENIVKTMIAFIGIVMQLKVYI